MTWTHGGSHMIPDLDADSKSGISFALNNDPEAQGSCKLRIITAEMSYGHGP